MALHIEVPEIGQIIEISLGSYEIVAYAIEVNDSGISPIAHLSPVDDNSDWIDETGNSDKFLNLYMYDFKEI